MGRGSGGFNGGRAIATYCMKLPARLGHCGLPAIAAWQLMKIWWAHWPGMGGFHVGTRLRAGLKQMVGQAFRAVPHGVDDPLLNLRRCAQLGKHHLAISRFT